MDAVLVLVALCGAGAAALLAARSPRFWRRVGQDAITAMLPKFMRPFRPKTLTKEELNKVAQGEDPFIQ